MYVEGAEPGDALVVDIISIKHKGWGWNAVIPNFGLLGEEFPEPYLHHYKLGETSCEFRPDIHIPYEPFCGVMGVFCCVPSAIALGLHRSTTEQQPI